MTASTFIVFCVAFFSKRWLVYAAGTNSDVCARNYLYPVFLHTKTQPRGFYQWIFIKDTPLPDWQDDQTFNVYYRMENKKYNAVGTVPKSNWKIFKRGEIDILTHKYMIDYFPSLAQALQEKMAGLS